MKTECAHNYEVKQGLFIPVCFVCRKCGAVKHLRRKYACLLFLLGCIGWIPSFFFESFEISWLLKLLLSVITYLAMNFVLDSLFYKWLATRNATQLSTFISDSDCFD